MYNSVGIPAVYEKVIATKTKYDEGLMTCTTLYTSMQKTGIFSKLQLQMAFLDKSLIYTKGDI